MNSLLVLTSGELTDEHSNQHGRQQVSFSQVDYMRKAAGCILNVFNKTKTKTKSPTHPTSPHPTPPHPAPLFLTLPTTHPSLPRNHKKDRKTNSQKTGTLASQIVRERQHIGHRRLVTPFVKRPAAELGRYGSWEVGGLAKGYRSPRID